MENTIARERMDEDGQQDHLLKACQNAVDHFNEKYHDFPKNGIHLHIGVSPDDPAKKEILMDTDLSNFPIRDYSGMWHDLNELIKNFKKISSRPAIKEDAQINKYAMHIIRLYATLLDILEKGRVQTYRLEEHDTLMNIRNGAFMNADGLMRPEFYEMLEDYKQRVGYAKENTCLPDKPDYTAINELSVHIHRKAVEKT